jgi:hypothetical protein
MKDISMTLAVSSSLPGKGWKRGVSAGMPDKMRREPEITSHMQMQEDNTLLIPPSPVIS